MGNGSRVITTKLFHFSWLGTWKILLHYHSSVFFLEKFVITKLCRISFTKWSSVQMLTCQNERICEKISFSREKCNTDWLRTKLFLVFWACQVHRITGELKLERTSRRSWGSAVRSDQVTQAFIQLGLLILQDQVLNSESWVRMREDRGPLWYQIIRRCQSDFAAVLAVTWIITVPILWVRNSIMKPQKNTSNAEKF